MSPKQSEIVVVSEEVAVKTLVPPTAAVVVESTEKVVEYTKYRKMKKMLPEGAVRQKMMVDGFTSEEIENFMSGVDVVTPSVPVAEPVDTLAQYLKMKQLLFEEAVRQKMIAEGVVAAQIDAFFAESPPDYKLVTSEPVNTISSATHSPIT
mmetsp:Transcript_15034/g.22222  ORF Transcript_15034/g.22222 Transcript_15034/m.22222 type:complete len:151 (-) Transcript_15034:600-1052(-)